MKPATLGDLRGVKDGGLVFVTNKITHQLTLEESMLCIELSDLLHIHAFEEEIPRPAQVDLDAARRVVCWLVESIVCRILRNNMLGRQSGI